MNTGEVKWSANISSTARVRRLPAGSRRAASRSSSPRTSLRCSTAARTRSFLVGKWCSWAPRLTPARWETSVVEVPLQPCSTRHSTVASSSRCRMARVRSSCGTRPGDTFALVTPRIVTAQQQTVKPDFYWCRTSFDVSAVARRQTPATHDWLAEAVRSGRLRVT